MKKNFMLVESILFCYLPLLINILLLIIPIYIYCRIACAINSKKGVYGEFKIISRIVLWTISIEFKNRPGLPVGGGPYIVASNHSSLLDIFIFGIFFEGYSAIAFMDKKLFKYPILGFFLKKMNSISIEVKTKKGILSSFKEAIKALEEGKHLLIFPEGTRTSDGELLPFNDGVARIANISKRKILPVGIAGAFEVSNKRTWIINPYPIIVFSGKVLDPKKLDVKIIMKELHNEIENLIFEGKKEIQKIKEFNSINDYL